jgi:hypothetical protein
VRIAVGAVEADRHERAELSRLGWRHGLGHSCRRANSLIGRGQRASSRAPPGWGGGPVRDGESLGGGRHSTGPGAARRPVRSPGQPGHRSLPRFPASAARYRSAPVRACVPPAAPCRPR